MAYFPKNKKRRSGLRRKGLRSKPKMVTKRRTATKSLRKVVQSIVSRNIENKIHQAYYEMPVGYINTDIDDMEFRGLFPITPYTSSGAPSNSTISIVQGTSQKSRIGNTIRTKQAILRGVMYPNYQGNNNPSPRPMEVCMWIFKIKGFGVTGSNGDTLAGAEYVLDNNFLQNAVLAGSATGLQGQLLDLLRPTNSDSVQVLYKRVFKVGTAEVVQSTQGALSNFQYYTNNDFKYNQKFSINVTKYLPKVIKYDDNDDMPSIRHTYVMIAPYNANGEDYDETPNVPIICQWSLEYHYEDA